MACSAAYSPERTAPSISPCISVAYSLAAQWMRPAGLRSASPYPRVSASSALAASARQGASRPKDLERKKLRRDGEILVGFNWLGAKHVHVHRPYAVARAGKALEI